MTQQCLVLKKGYKIPQELTLHLHSLGAILEDSRRFGLFAEGSGFDNIVIPKSLRS